MKTNGIERFLDNMGRVRTWPAKKSKKIKILEYVAGKFEPGRIYTEKEVNAIIDHWHTFGDYFIIRRGMIDNSLMSRTKNGSQYWVEVKPV